MSERHGTEMMSSRNDDIAKGWLRITFLLFLVVY